MTQHLVRAGLVLLILGLAGAAAALAGEPAAGTEPAAQPASDLIASPRVTVVEGSLDRAPAISSGMMVAIDPATGERREPTADEAADLSAAARFRARHPDDADLQQFAVRSGGTGVLLDSRFLISETVELRLDGTLSAGHRTGLAEPLGFLQPALTEGNPAGDGRAAETEVQP